MSKHWFFGTAAAVLTVLICSTIAYAALTFEATTITSDAALTLTTASGSNVAVTRGISFNSATSTDSLYIGGLTQLTGATASGTALVICNDVPLFRSAANTLKIQGILALKNSETIGNTTDANIFVNATGVSIATTSATTTRSMFVSAPAGTATTTIEVSGPEGSRGACLELWQENVSYRVYVIATSTDVTMSGYT